MAGKQKKKEIMSLSPYLFEEPAKRGRSLGDKAGSTETEKT